MSQKVTILIPTYNRLIFLKKTINALCNLDSSFFKIFIQDNASTDGTHEYLLTLEKKFTNINFIRNQSNLGAIKNHQLIVNHDHKTPYLMFICDDDVVSLEYFISIKEKVLLNYYDFIIYCHPNISKLFTNNLICGWWGSQSIPGFCFKTNVVKEYYPSDLSFVYPQTTFVVNAIISGKTIDIHHVSPIIRPSIESKSEMLNTLSGFKIRGSEYCIIKRFNLIRKHINNIEKKSIMSIVFDEVLVLNYHLIVHHKYIRLLYFNLILFIRFFYEKPSLTLYFYFFSLYKVFLGKYK